MKTLMNASTLKVDGGLHDGATFGQNPFQLMPLRNGTICGETPQRVIEANNNRKRKYVRFHSVDIHDDLQLTGCHTDATCGFVFIRSALADKEGLQHRRSNWRPR